MIGYIVTTETRDQIATAIMAAQTGRGVTPYIELGANLIHTGEQAGVWFVGLSDADLAVKCHGRPPVALGEFPETQALITSLGGLAARVTIDPSILLDPSAPEI